jgi:hypothetical protein
MKTPSPVLTAKCQKTVHGLLTNLLSANYDTAIYTELQCPFEVVSDWKKPNYLQVSFGASFPW